MFQINRESNSVIALDKRSFSELKFTERKHLQEWIDQYPGILGEKLLIIQKEFDGFSDTSERLDLLALDEEGRLVIIENKLDDSGRNVVWQALKYVSYCASLSKNEIRDIYQQYLNKYKGGGDAGIAIADFFECLDFDEVKINASESDQRVVLVAANFRKEVTSTVLWLQKHAIDVKCIRVTPYQKGEELFLDTEQILPPPSTEEYQIKLGLKKREEQYAQEEITDRQKLRYRFWTFALPKLVVEAGIYQNISPTKDCWITGSSGHSGIGFNSIILMNGARAEVFLGLSNREDNKRLFQNLAAQKDVLEAQFGAPLDWDELPEKIGCRISISISGIDMSDEHNWPTLVGFLAKNIKRLRDVFAKPINDALQAKK